MEPAVLILGGTVAIKPVASWYYRRMQAEVVALPYGGICRITDTYRLLASQIEYLVGDRPVILIGHSQGGLLATMYAQEHANVRKVLALSTPYNGTKAAWAGWLMPSARDMLPGSSFITNLQQQLPQVADRIVSIFLRRDVLINPFDSPRVPGARNVLMANIRHLPKLLSWHEDVELREGSFNHISEIAAPPLIQILEEIRREAA